MNSDTPAADIERWRRARQLFLDVCTLPLSERGTFLDAANAGGDVIEAVRRLLLRHDEASDAGTDIPPHPLADVFLAALERADKETATLGEFRIERTLGEGGMGRVYLAVRETVGVVQRVALKVAPPMAYRPRLIEQLRRERAILAGLEHPLIAHLIDVGELPDGRPYFAMEYVDGVPLLRYCDEAKLDLSARITLFLSICEAVSYAHRRLVLHRDLKDSNILVDAAGHPRLLDFGIAKSLDDTQTRETTLGQNYFSLRAAAPEQIRGAATTVATDVYGLGCVLYELLSGQLPFDLIEGRRDEQLRRILEQPPTLTSAAVTAAADDAAALQRGQSNAGALAAALRGDLDAVVARALRKDPAERFPSVDHLAADLRNILAQRPIAERASERWYRLRMLLRRHRLTAAVAIVLGAAVVTTTALSVVQSLRAAAERDRAVAALDTARLQRDHAQQVTDFLVNAFQAADREGLTRNLTAVKLLDNAAAALERDSTRLEPALRTTLAQTLSHLFFLLQRKPEAIRLGNFARHEMQETPGLPGEVRVRQFLIDAETAFLENRYDDAVKAADAGLELAGDAAIYSDGEVLPMLWEAKLRSLLGRNENGAAIQAADTAIAQLSRRPDLRPERFDWFRLHRANALYAWGRHDEYLASLQQLVAEQRAQGRSNGASHIRALADLAHAYKIHQQEDKALPIYAEALAKQEALYGEDHPMTASLLGGMAGAYIRAGQKQEGLELIFRVIALHERTSGKVSNILANTYFYLGEHYLFDMQDIANAEYFVRRAISVAPPQSRGNIGMYERRLATLLVRQERWFEAAYHIESGVDTMTSMYGRNGNFVEGGLVDRAYIALRRYDLASASAGLEGTLLAGVRARLDGSAADYYYVQDEAEARQLSALFGWNRADGSTVAPPLR